MGRGSDIVRRDGPSMIEAQRTWLITHLHEGHGLPGDEEAYESFADLKAAHDLLHQLQADEEVPVEAEEVVGQNGQAPVG